MNAYPTYRETVDFPRHVGLKELRRVLIVLTALVAMVTGTAAPHSAAAPLGFISWGNKAEPLRATVMDAFIDMRKGPGRGYPIFYIAERGETVQVLKQRTDWIKVRNQRGIAGWVHVDQMARTRDQNDQLLAVDRANRESYEKRKWEVGTLLGDFGGASAITAYASYHLTGNLSLEGAYTETFGEFSNGSAKTIAIVHQPFPKWRISPFFTIGAGVRETNPQSTLVSVEDRVDDELNVGAGFKAYLGRRFILRLQYKNHTILTDRDDDEEVTEWKLGLSTFF